VFSYKANLCANSYSAVLGDGATDHSESCNGRSCERTLGMIKCLWLRELRYWGNGQIRKFIDDWRSMVIAR
jgi:hypothetical protein